MFSHAGCFWTRWVSLAAVLTAGITAPARGWDEDGHAIVTFLACDAMPADMPAWIKTPEVRARLVYLSSEPDRWRGQLSHVLNHINNADHYIDEEKLRPFGLTLKTLPPFRRQFIDLLATQRALHSEAVKPRNAKKDRDYLDLTPGLLPYRIAELQWKIAAGWTQLLTYEKYPDRVSQSMIQNARENIIYHMGILSHYVGDGAQPLHLTIHHHGWVGSNPKGYTTEHDFHRYIDDLILRHHHISYDGLKGRAKAARKTSPQQPWGDTLGYLWESYELVDALYALQKSDKLDGPEGKRFIEDRLLTGGSMLAGIWVAGYRASHTDKFRVQRLLERYPKEPGRAPKSQPTVPIGRH